LVMDERLLQSLAAILEAAVPLLEQGNEPDYCLSDDARIIRDELADIVRPEASMSASELETVISLSQHIEGQTKPEGAAWSLRDESHCRVMATLWPHHLETLRKLAQV